MGSRDSRGDRHTELPDARRARDSDVESGLDALGALRCQGPGTSRRLFAGPEAGPADPRRRIALQFHSSRTDAWGEGAP